MHRATADLRKSEIPGFQPRGTAPGPHQRVPRAGRGGGETVASARAFPCGAHTLLRFTLYVSTSPSHRSFYYAIAYQPRRGSAPATRFPLSATMSTAVA